MCVIDLYVKCVKMIDVVVVREENSNKEMIISVKKEHIIPVELHKKEVSYFDIFENENYETVMYIEVFS